MWHFPSKAQLYNPSLGAVRGGRLWWCIFKNRLFPNWMSRVHHWGDLSCFRGIRQSLGDSSSLAETKFFIPTEFHTFWESFTWDAQPLQPLFRKVRFSPGRLGLFHQHERRGAWKERFKWIHMWLNTWWQIHVYTMDLTYLYLHILSIFFWYLGMCDSLRQFMGKYLEGMPFLSAFSTIWKDFHVKEDVSFRLSPITFQPPLPTPPVPTTFATLCLWGFGLSHRGGEYIAAISVVKPRAKLYQRRISLQGHHPREIIGMDGMDGGMYLLFQNG